MKGKATSGYHREGESTDAKRRDGAARSSDEGSVMELERRGCVVQPRPRANWRREESVDEAKPFKIPKREVWEAFKRVKANQGTAVVRVSACKAAVAGVLSATRISGLVPISSLACTRMRVDWNCRSRRFGCEC